MTDKWKPSSLPARVDPTAAAEDPTLLPSGDPYNCPDLDGKGFLQWLVSAFDIISQAYRSLKHNLGGTDVTQEP